MTDTDVATLLALAEAGRRTRVVPALLSTDLRRTDAFFHTEPPQGTPAIQVMSGTIYVFPESVDALAEEWQGKVEFHWGPELTPYGLYEFGITDPDGYHLAFAERRSSTGR